MPETGSLTQEIKERLEAIGTADVVIGLPTLQNSEDLQWTAQLANMGARILIAYPNHIAPVAPEEREGVELVEYEISASDRYLHSPPSIFGSFQDVFQISQRVGAKCCFVWNSNPGLLSQRVIEKVLPPILNQGFDLVLPCYAEMKFGSLVNSSIVYPAVRALYGKRIGFSMAADLSFSASFVDRLLQIDPKTRTSRSQQWITTEAICSGLSICQANLPMEPPHPPESVDVSSILTLVLGRLFQDLERNIAFWQRSSGSVAVATFGESITKAEGEDRIVDVQPLIETFQLGHRNLREIWTVALPPATLLDLKKLTGLTAATFRMPDDLWTRIVYDFALAHRQRAINREHLLRAMTPLYLAWVASHALEMKEASPAAIQLGRERLALAYEKHKPYLLSRWRWPDRFNP